MAWHGIKWPEPVGGYNRDGDGDGAILVCYPASLAAHLHPCRAMPRKGGFACGVVLVRYGRRLLLLLTTRSVVEVGTASHHIISHHIMPRRRCYCPTCVVVPPFRVDVWMFG